MGSVGPQGAVDVSKLFFNREFIGKTVEETNRYSKQGGIN
jgi:hypothetical protein